MGFCFYFRVFHFYFLLILGIFFGSIIFRHDGFPFLSKRIISSSILGSFIFSHIWVSLFIFGFPLGTLWVLSYIRLISLLPYGLYVCLVFYCLR